MRLGDLDVSLVSDGGFRLDGGAMFGVVPKVLWERLKAPDEQNRIRMTATCPLISKGDDLILIDTGAGDKLSDKLRGIYGMDDTDLRLPASIEAAGYRVEDVTHVLLTHLHFDHCGWNTRVVNGALRPTFPNARYWISRSEVDHARDPNLRDQSTYIPENWEPLFEAGVVELFDGEVEPVPGVRMVEIGGHSPGMSIALLGSGDERAVFLADLVPTMAHVAWAWIMAYDLEPMVSLALKQEWIPRFAAEEWLCIFEHDAENSWGRILESRPGQYRAEPLA